MPKNGKSKEKERNQIIPEERNRHDPIEYYIQSGVGNADHQIGSSHCKWERTNRSTTGLPTSAFPEKEGVLLGLRKEMGGRDNTGYQLYINKHGRLATRFIDNGSGTWQTVPNVSDVTTKVNEIVNQTFNPNHYFKKPEHNKLPPRSNLDNVKESGIYHVQNDSTGVPDSVDNTWGILQVYKEGGGVFQLYVAVDGTERGKVFTRTYLGSSWAEWRSFDQTHDHLFSHPQPLPSNTVSKTTPTGYYITDQSTQGLPNGISGADKKGFLKVLKDNDHGILTFTSSTNNKVYTGYYNATTRSSNDLNWNEVNGTEGHTKIHDSRDQEQQAPTIYAQHASSNKGFLVYEWKWARTIRLYQNGGTPPDTTFDPPLKSDESILLKTVVPQGSHLVGNDIVHQIGFAIASHRTFYRKANERAGNTWTKWVEIGVGEHGANISKPENENPIDNANDVAYSGVFRTQSSPLTQGLPATNNTEGFLTHYKKDSNSAIQYWTAIAGDKAGKFFTRTKVGGQWSTHWSELGTGGSTPSFTESMADAKYTIKPEVNSTKYVSDFNNINGLAQWGSGTYYFKNTGLSNKPSGMSDGWGTMTVNFQSIGSKTGNMFVCPSTGASKGKIYYRSFENGNGTPWKEITATGGGSQVTDDHIRSVIRNELRDLFNQLHT